MFPTVGILLGCISIASIVLYCLRRSSKLRARRDDLPIVIPIKFVEDENRRPESV